MSRFARWHIWLGWLVGVPILMWTLTGLVMVARPVEQVRGEHLRVAQDAEVLPAGIRMPGLSTKDDGPAVEELRVSMQNGRAVTVVRFADGRRARFDAFDGSYLGPVGAGEARRIVSESVIGGDEVIAIEAYSSDRVPFDFRRAMPIWQVSLEGGTHVYVSRETGQIEAIRTRWWRLFDFMWGLHIMDLQTREDTSHPTLILFAALGVIGSSLGCALMFRRRRRRKTVSG